MMLTSKQQPNLQFNPEMLILARESRGWTQSQLAELSGITQGNISKYETGLIQIPTEHARQIADLLHYPVSLFVSHGRRYGFGSNCTFHRKRQTMPVKELSKLLAEVNLRRLAISHLLSNVEIEAANEFPRLDLDDFDGDPALVAREVRRYWKVPRGPIPNLTALIESAGGIVCSFSFGTNKLDAISQLVPGLPPLFFVNSDAPADRMRFTLAHEIGHIFMHTIPTADRHDHEREADKFASEFLMPATDVASYLRTVNIPSLAKLKPFWRTSMAALARRAHDLGSLSDWGYRQICIQLSSSGYRVKEPVSIEAEQPAILPQIITVLLQEREFTVSELAGVTNLHEDEFRQQCGLEPTRQGLRMVGQYEI